MIVHVIAGLNQGGAEQTLFRLLSAMPSDTHVVSLSDDGVFAPRLRALGIPVTCLFMQRGTIPSPVAVFRFWRVLRRLRPSLVQTWMYHADLLGGLGARAVGVQVVWNIRHGALSAAANSHMTRLVVWVCARFSGWMPVTAVCCSARAAEFHRALGYRCRIQIIANGIDTTHWQPDADVRVRLCNALGIPADSVLIGHAGRADVQKDHPTLLRAFHTVAQREKKAHLLLCGRGLQRDEPYFQALPLDAACDARVHALGARDDLPQIFPALDAFVLSSTGEAFPNVVAEAMACGIPCVVTDVGDAAEIVGDTGWVVTAGDPAVLAEAILVAVRLPSSDRIERGMAARHRVQEHFTVDRMVDAYGQLWRDVLSKDK